MEQFPEKDFNGYLEGVVLADIVHLACLKRYERMLQVWGPDFSGFIYFSEGEVVHAEIGDSIGKEAFIEIMGHESGNLTLTPETTEQKTIHDSWNLLLKEAGLDVDETIDVRVDQPEVDESNDVRLDQPEADERDDVRVDQPEVEQFKVLVVDDSHVFSKALVELFAEDLGAKIIGKASNGKEALKFLELETPDLITLDINMPVMSGDATLKHIMIRTPAPVVLMSSFNERNFPMMMDYLCIGAVDLVAKPKDAVSWNIVGKRLSRLVQNMSQFNIQNIRRAKKPEPVGYKKNPGGKVDKLLLVLGGLGGLIELQKILVAIKENKSTAGLVFLDLYPGVTDHLASYFDNLTVCNPLSLLSGAPLLASEFGITYWHGSWEIIVDSDGTVFPVMRNEMGLLDADELLKSAARVFGENLSVVILSGTDLDMRSGLEKVKEKGGKILLQDPDSCLFPEPLVKLQEMQIHDAFIAAESLDECLGGFFE